MVNFLYRLRLEPNFIEHYNTKCGAEEVVQFKKSISNWAFCSEKIMHGNPSGLDNTICTFGNMVKFYRGQQPETFEMSIPLNVLLINSGVERSTATLVQQVAELKEAHPALVGSILDAMGHCVDDIIEVNFI